MRSKAPSLSEHHYAVLGALRTVEGATPERVAVLLGRRLADVETILADLERAGLVAGELVQ